MKSRSIVPVLILLAVTSLSATGRSNGYDWEVGDEFEITKGNILFFSSLGDIETCLRSSVDDPLEGLNSPLAKRAQEIFHYQTEKIGEGTKVALIDSAVLRITINPLTCYQAKAAKGDYKTTGWFVDVNGAGAWNDYSAEPSEAVIKRQERKALEEREDTRKRTEAEIDYVRNYKILSSPYTISGALNEIINNWRSRGRIVGIIEGWREVWENATEQEKQRRNLPLHGDIFAFDFAIGLSAEDISACLKPYPFNPLMTLESVKNTYDLYGAAGEKIKYGTICSYRFAYDNISGDITFAWLDLPNDDLFGMGLPPFKLPLKFHESTAYSDYWPISERGYLPSRSSGYRRWLSKCEDILEGFNQYKGLYFEVDDRLTPDKPTNSNNVFTDLYEPDARRITVRRYDENGVLASSYYVHFYDAAGRLVCRRWVGEEDSTLSEMVFQYNTDGYLIETRDYDGYVRYSYDVKGRIVEFICLDTEKNPMIKELWPHNLHRIKWDYAPAGNIVTETRYGINTEILGKDVVELW